LKVKSWLVVTLVLALVMGAGTALALEPIRILVNGQEVVGDTPAQIINNRTMVPIRLVAEALDADVRWDEVNRQVVITTAENGEETWNLLKVNGELTTWPYWIIDGKLYMEYRNLLNLLQTKYKAPWHMVNYSSNSDSYLIDSKSVRVYPEQVGDFKVISLEDLQRNRIITYEWQEEEENLVFDLSIP
jgi:hypothetical protein